MNDPSLPDFQNDAYRRMSPVWRFVDDIYQGSTAWIDRLPSGEIKANTKTQTYLPKFAKEHPQDYLARLSRTPYSDRYKQAIRDFVGLIFHNGIKTSDQFEQSPIFEHWSSISLSGQAARVFLAEVAIAVMRRGHSFILVDAPRHSLSAASLADQQSFRPYWQHIEATQVLSFEPATINGVEVLESAVVCMSHKVRAGKFGSIQELSYLHLTPGRYDTYTIAETKDAQGRVTRSAVHHPDQSGIYGRYENGALRSLDRVPLVPVYGGTKSGFCESEPPLYALADLNATHYQVYSDHLNKIHTCCFPMPVRIGGDEDDLVIGPGVVINLPIGGAFLYAEPLATSIEQSRKEIESLEYAMDFLGVQYLIKPSDRQAAMVSLMQAAKVESSLELFAQAFAQGINDALQVHALYAGVNLPSAAIALDTRFFAQGATDPNLLQAYILLFQSIAQMPSKLALSLLDVIQRRGFVPQEIEVHTLIQENLDHATGTRSTDKQPVATGNSTA